MIELLKSPSNNEVRVDLMRVSEKEGNVLNNNDNPKSDVNHLFYCYPSETGYKRIEPLTSFV